MAYHIGQLRKTANVQYMELVSEEETPGATSDSAAATYGLKYVNGITNMLSPNDFNIGTDFYDFAITFNNENKFKTTQTYFLNFKLKLPCPDERDHALSYKILLKNWPIATASSKLSEQQASNPPQVIDNFVLSLATTTGVEEYMYYSTVFTPRKNADYLVFRYNRIMQDNAQNGNSTNWLASTSGSTVFDNITFADGANGYGIYTLNNLRNTEEQTPWIRLGYQSRPGNLIVVNKEPIRVGRSGIFQLDKIQVDSFMIATPRGSLWSTIDPFLLDYAYND